MNRKLAYRINSVIYTIVVFLVLATLYHIGSLHPMRYDATKDKIRSLSDKTIKVLTPLQKPVHVIAFLAPGGEDREMIDDLLKEYAKRSRRIVYRTEDPERNPAEFQKYGMNGYGIVFVSGGNKRIVKYDELFQYKYSPYGEPVPDAFLGEQAFTGAIVAVTSAGQKKLCFTEGHGERSAFGGEDRDYSGIRDLLEGENYKLRAINLLTEKQVPEECSVVLLLGPEKFLADVEMKELRKYLDGGGRALFLLDPLVSSGAEVFLKDYGVEVGTDVVIDRKSFYGESPLSPIPIPAPHEITAPLENSKLSVSLFFTRSVRPAAKLPAGVAVDPLLVSSDDSWGETDMSAKNAIYNEGIDLKGPVSLAVAVEKKLETGGEGKEEAAAPAEDAGEPAPAEENKTRIVVIGDADFASNGFVFQHGLLKVLAGGTGNTDLFVNAVNWLVGEENMISIRPKPADFKPLDMAGNRPLYIYLLFVIAFPAALIAAGTMVWIRRRSL